MYLSGYARMDFRMRPDGSVFVLEANANPNISHKEDFADSAHAAGVDYSALLEQLIRLGCNYEAAWRLTEEGFMQGLPFDDLKIRAGYGVTGIAPTSSYLSRRAGTGHTAGSRSGGSSSMLSTDEPRE